jgi:endonuclease I
MPILYIPTKEQKFNINHSINLEHIYPKCYLKNENKLEFHNIFASNIYINKLRSNYKFASSKNYKLFNKINHKNKIFIPSIRDRGIIARSLLFMINKYNYTSSNVIIDKKLLYKWNRKYKPSLQEKIHNFIGLQIQDYDNPFITNYPN